MTDNEPIKLILPKLYPLQHQAIYDPERYSLIEASTKSGKTHGCIAWAIDKASRLKNGQEGWWIAPSHKQANIAFKRVCRYLPRGIFKSNKAEKTVTFSNGAVLAFYTGEDPDLLYGEDVYFAILDEASRMRQEVWGAIRSTLTATHGPVRIIGNVKGRANWFYKMCRKAQSGANNYSYHKITAWDAVDAGIVSKQEVLDAQEDLAHLPGLFEELYLAEPCDDLGNPFGQTWINECTMVNGLTNKDPVCWGWDWAKERDWTVGIALDEDGRMCRFTRFQKKPWRETKKIAINLIGDTPALTDSTGLGSTILEDIQAECPKVEGQLFSVQGKQKLMEDLANAIQSEEIAFTEEVKAELDIFEYTYTRRNVLYSAPEGCHDDMVDALALANHLFRSKGRSDPNDSGFW
jgi:phage FluMu gp28-like protein